MVIYRWSGPSRHIKTGEFIMFESWIMDTNEFKYKQIRCVYPNPIYYE